MWHVGKLRAPTLQRIRGNVLQVVGHDADEARSLRSSAVRGLLLLCVVTARRYPAARARGCGEAMLQRT